MTQTTLNTQPPEKPLTEWEQIVLKLVNGELEEVGRTEWEIDFFYNKNKYSTWVGSRDAESFGCLYRINSETADNLIQDKTQIRPKIQEKLRVFAKLTDNDILQKFEEKYFKL